MHLTVDTSLQGGRMGLKAYVCINLGVPGGKSGCMFTPINTDVTYYEPEVSPIDTNFRRKHRYSFACVTFSGGRFTTV